MPVVHPARRLLGLAAVAAALAACHGGGSQPRIRQIEVPDAPAGDIEVGVTLSSEDSQPTSVQIDVSNDQQTWLPASLAEDPVTVGLPTSPEGVHYVFTWDSLKDLGFRISGDTWIRITAVGEGGLVDIQEQKLNRIANLLPAAKRVRSYMIHSGPITTSDIAFAKTHELVVFYGSQASVTREAIRAIQKGIDPLDPRDDVIVLGYLDVGEDERTIDLDDSQLLADPRFTGDGLGPRVDPRGPGADGQSLAGVDLGGLPSASGGFASFYLDDNDVEAHGVGDGHPDRNAVTGACYTNIGHPAWVATLTDARIADDGFAGIRENLSTEYGEGLGFDGLYLDNVDTCAPNAFTGQGDPDHATFEWTAPGVTALCGEIRRLYPEAVLMQNRGMFFFDPQQPHYAVTTGPLIDFLGIESFRLDRETSHEYDPYVFADNEYNMAPKLQAEAQRFTFQVLSLGYAAGPGIDPLTLVGQSQAGFDTLIEDVRAAERVGFRHYLTSADGELVNSFARDHMTTADTTPPQWSSTYNAYGSYAPPQAPVARVGIQQLEVGPGSVTIRWDVALDQDPVTYYVFYDTRPLVFGSNGFPTRGTRQELYPARVSTSYAAGPGPATYPFEAGSTEFSRNTDYWFCIMARDRSGNWAKNQVVLSARTQ